MANSLIEKLEVFKADFQNLENKESELLHLREDLIHTLETASKREVSLKQKNELVQLSNSVKDELKTCMTDWMRDWDDTLATRELAETYSDRIIFLVFGKVNAGKSSFCNWLTESFPENNVQRFKIKGGKPLDINEKFKEGVTETTAAIQGVKIDNKLILLDSPGLHSVTDENDQLTRKFTDAADAVLWLTPSVSPGQTHELSDLRHELQCKKPLQPVITRSDESNEDIDDNGQLITTLCNKSAARRQAQEEDVFARTREELESEVPLEKPISISVHTYKGSNRTLQDQADAGLTNLLDRLATLIDDAASYKVRKARQQVINYLDQKVLNRLKQDIEPSVLELDNLAEKHIGLLENRKHQITTNVIADILLLLDSIAEKHKETQNKKLVLQDVNQLIISTLTNTMQEELEEFSSSFNQIACSLSPKSISNFEDVTVKVEQCSGNAAAATVSAGGGAIGGAVGFAVGGPVGAAVGGVIGSFFGGKAGKAIFVETKTVTEKVGVSTEKVVDSLTREIKTQLPKVIDGTVDGIIRNIHDIKAFNTEILNAMKSFETDVTNLKES